MHPYDPYAPPRSDLGLGDPSGFQGYGVWQQEGRAVMFRTGAMLPSRCAVCNGPGKHRVSKTFFWHEPWLYVLILGGVLVYAIAALIARKSAGVEYWLCDEHRKRRTAGFLIGWLGFSVSFILMFVAAANEVPALVFVSLAGMIALPVAGGIMARGVSPARITDGEVWLKAGEPFVASLPPSPQMGGGAQYGAMGYGTPAGGVYAPPRW